MKMLNAIKDFSHIHPDTLAYISPTEEMTYGELWRQSEQVAAFLLKQNMEKPVLVYGHMNASMISSFLGCIKAGLPYIPVDTSIPTDRVLKIIASSQAEMMINASNQELMLDNVAVSMVTIDKIQAEQILGIPIDPSNWVFGEENFYIIYTSGSTGNPKGVQISANNLQSFVDWMIADFPIAGGLRFLNQAPYSFDLSVMDLYPALASGGTIFSITKEMIARPKLLFEALAISKSQVWTSTPSFVQMCLMDPSFTEELLPELSVFLFCGEILPVEICRQLRDRFPKARIFNTYGPTEATVAVTSVEVTAEILETHQNLPIGKPKGDTRIFIVDEYGVAVRPAEKGEMIIVGPSVSKGYLGQQELTEKSFFQYEGEQAYRTGDAAYVDQDGLIFYKGRMDFQIKLHGYRMELEEIEYHMANCKFVKSAAVIPIYQQDKIDYLLAAIIPETHNFEKEYQLTTAIKKELSEVMPAYMIPRKFSYYQELPLTPNGKMDRKKCKEMVVQ
ncbi:D-alanine--poly(phosphoribitol) ligase subunit 1 [Neobacillus bataviensis LMG 21833]|uniref:D-alanine--D-alanyl carrier protein ligase n=1 Tax=Neobacillus bataviensis LMG 21833 TaxID=1117379 RepID=K6EBD8_9BACI|nr:D-alanine--poly(phosphoribitol) ligase subunit DltA [Neobacillus bataviensis]EKN70746.1 D-alanine--poly(phosphoribitol) ligase subunit 1 [Neobacillus bataviensis LMG 21833]